MRWARMQALDMNSINAAVDAMLDERNLRIEMKDERGRWIEAPNVLTEGDAQSTPGARQGRR